MDVYVYRSAEGLLGFTGVKDGRNLPTAHGPWMLANRLIMSAADDDRPMVRTTECLDDIEMHGFHILDGLKRVTERMET